MKDGTQCQLKVNQKIIYKLQVITLLCHASVLMSSRSADEANSQPCVTQIFKKILMSCTLFIIDLYDQ